MYPEEMCKPMREDLSSVGFIEMKTQRKLKIFLIKQRDSISNGEFCLWML